VPRGRERARGREARLAELLREAAEAGTAARGTNVRPESGACAPIYPHRHRCAPLDGAGTVRAEQSRQHLASAEETCHRPRPPVHGRGELQKGRFTQGGHSGCGRCRLGDLAAGARRQSLVLADAHDERSRGWAAAGALPSCVVGAVTSKFTIIPLVTLI
jgi:hypothetical protein